MMPTMNVFFVGMPIKKVGRTTELTTGTVSAVNLTVNVGYSSGVDAYDAVSAIYEWNYAGNDGQRYLLAGDVDGDGYDEAVFAGYENVGVLEEGGTEKWTRDFSGTAANYENDASWDIEDMILADLDGDGDLDVAVGAYEMVNLRMLDGLTGVDMTAPVIIDGYAYSTQQLAAGDFVSDGEVGNAWQCHDATIPQSIAAIE